MLPSAKAPEAIKAVIIFSITFLGRDGMAHIRTRSPRASIVREFPRRPQEIARSRSGPVSGFCLRSSSPLEHEPKRRESLAMAGIAGACAHKQRPDNRFGQKAGGRIFGELAFAGNAVRFCAFVRADRECAFAQ